jgi:hypothetical protein
MPQKLPSRVLAAQMTDAEWKPYVAMRDEMVIELEHGNASIAQQAITKFMRLSQITGGFLGGIADMGLDPPCPECDGVGCDSCEFSGIGATQPTADVREIGRAKLDVLHRLVGELWTKEPDAKMIIWCRFIPETERIIRELTAKHNKAAIVGLHGKNTKAERARVKTLLHPLTATPGPVACVGTLGTGSFGLDFSAAHISINYSYDHSLRKFLQSGDRVYGPRQLNDIQYFDIVAVGPRGQKTYDSVIVQARRDKQDLATWSQATWVKALSD